MSKIEINNVYKIFGPKPNQVLDMVKGGAGKDEILEKTGLTVGLDNVSLTDGEIIVEGTNVMNLSKEKLIEFRRHKMSMVFQRFGLFPHKTVLQNVGYGLEMQGIDPEKRNSVAME